MGVIIVSIVAIVSFGLGYFVSCWRSSRTSLTNIGSEASASNISSRTVISSAQDLEISGESYSLTRLANIRYFIFVDNSNLWIGGKEKEIGVNLVKLKSLLSNGQRQDSKAVLYGSSSESDSSYWDAAKRKGYEVKIFERAHDGHEKEVDVAMACDIVEKLYTIGCTEKAFFVIVTGDRDLKPAIMKCIEKKVHVELWSWEDPLSAEFNKLADGSSLFSVNLLDNYKDDIRYIPKRKTD